MHMPEISTVGKEKWAGPWSLLDRISKTWITLEKQHPRLTSDLHMHVYAHSPAYMCAPAHTHTYMEKILK